MKGSNRPRLKVMAAVTLASCPLYAALEVRGFYVMAVVASLGLVPIALGVASAPERRLRR